MFDPKIAFKEIALGNQAAEDFMVGFYQWIHTLDDLIDRDRPILLETVHSNHLGLIVSVSANEFFLKYRDSLLPVIVMSALAHQESERLRNAENVLDRVASQVIKSQYQDVFYLVAFLVGGYAHASAMSRKFREYCYDPTPPPVSKQKQG